MAAPVGLARASRATAPVGPIRRGTASRAAVSSRGWFRHGLSPAAIPEAALLEELVRVAALLPVGPLTQARFASESSIDPLTFLRQFGSWREALVKAGLEDRYSGRQVTPKMRRSVRAGAVAEAYAGIF